ncbi:hypothetical protein [Halalkalibacter akibai]|nr:hypothetical protein [Halalkalibacter akibai]
MNDKGKAFQEAQQKQIQTADHRAKELMEIINNLKSKEKNKVQSNSNS